MLTAATVHLPLDQTPCIVICSEVLTFFKQGGVLGADWKMKR